MSVEAKLAMDGTDGLLTRADGRWRSWSDSCPNLAEAPRGLAPLREWLAVVTPEQYNAVLGDLAQLAATDGGDDLAAAAVLAHCLLPGISNVAARVVRRLAPGVGAPAVRGQWGDDCSGDFEAGDVDGLAAAQLWIEVRSFSWRGHGKVAGTVVRNVEHQVLRQIGLEPPRHKIRQHSIPCDLVAELGSVPGHERVSAAEELLEVLDWAHSEGVIDHTDRALLLGTVEELARQELTPYERRCGGLLAAPVTRALADRVDLAEPTIRRRVGRSVKALAKAAPKFLAA